MIQDIFPSLFNRFGLYYGFINNDMLVKFESVGIFDYLNIAEITKPLPISEVFYEIIGSENEIKKVISGEKNEYSILNINRDTNEEIFFNIYFLHHPFREYKAIAVIKDVTNEILFRQYLHQNKNEISLLQDKLIEKNNDLNIINRDLTTSRDLLKNLNIELEEKVVLRTTQFEESSDLAKRLFYQTVNSLMSALEMRDPYTSGHQQRVSQLACAISLKMGLDEITLEGIEVAGKVHDIGKIYLPSEFLTRPGVLSEEEYNVIKTHSRFGFEILKDIEFPWPVASIVLQHHELLDGSGYPNGLKEKDIRLEAKIITVADVVEAMATNRPYRISPGIDRAIDEIIANKGIKYDTQAVEACVEILKAGSDLFKS